MDVLYRFSVLNTAFSTITKEIADQIRRLGSSWHFCLFIWTLYFGIAEIKQDFFNIGPVSAAMFICASLYLVFTDYTEKIFKFDVLKYVSKVCLYLSLPFVLVYYVWVPLNKGVRCMLNKLVGQCDESLPLTVSTVIVVFVSVLLCILQGWNLKPKAGPTSQKSPGTPVQRRVSARILARKQRQ